MKQLTITYGSLFLAIVLEATGTTLLKKTEEFTRIAPTLAMAACYLAAFYLLTIVLRVMPVGVTYAIWSGLGIVLISILGIAFYRQYPDIPALIGLCLILAGVLVINLFSSTVSH